MYDRQDRRREKKRKHGQRCKKLKLDFSGFLLLSRLVRQITFAISRVPLASSRAVVEMGGRDTLHLCIFEGKKLKSVNTQNVAHFLVPKEIVA